MSDDNGDWAFLLFGDGFALDAGFQGSVEETGDKCLNIGSGDILRLIEGEFLVLRDILNCERRPLLLTSTR
jgi:hypothetical protein